MYLSYEYMYILWQRSIVVAPRTYGGTSPVRAIDLENLDNHGDLDYEPTID
jgi:hypothetical protein